MKDERTTVKAPQPELGPQNSQEKARHYGCANVGLYGWKGEGQMTFTGACGGAKLE